MSYGSKLSTTLTRLDALKILRGGESFHNFSFTLGSIDIESLLSFNIVNAEDVNIRVTVI